MNGFRVPDFRVEGLVIETLIHQKVVWSPYRARAPGGPSVTSDEQWQVEVIVLILVFFFSRLHSLSGWNRIFKELYEWYYCSPLVPEKRFTRVGRRRDEG